MSFVKLHAGVSRVELELDERDGGLLIAMVDDGPGGKCGVPGWSRCASYSSGWSPRGEIVGSRLDGSSSGSPVDASVIGESRPIEEV